MSIEAFDRVRPGRNGIRPAHRGRGGRRRPRGDRRGPGRPHHHPERRHPAAGAGRRGVRAYLDDADLVVADGMPLVWASRLSGTPLPERVAGSSLIWSLSAGLGRDGRSVYVLGGSPGDRRRRADGADPGRRPGSPRTARACGSPAPCAPRSASSATRRLRRILRRVAERPARPRLRRTRLPQAGAGHRPAARRAAADLVHRLRRGGQLRRRRRRPGAALDAAHRAGVGAPAGTEPRRLAGRYLRHDAPYALRLLAGRPRRGPAPRRS